jgi:chromosome segregation ATPase
LQEKARLEDILEEKRVNIAQLQRDIEDLKFRNATIDDKVNQLRIQVQRREEENRELDERVRELHRQLDKITDENRGMEGEIGAIEGEIADLRNQIDNMEHDKLNATNEYEDCKARNADNARIISQLENQLFGLERDLKHFNNMNENYRSEIVSCEKSYQS